MEEEKMVSEKDETEGQQGEKRAIAVSDNMIILLLILFTLMIGGWWLLNLYMGRWI